VDFYKFLDIYFAYLGNAVKYNILKTCCTISVSFPTNCYLMQNLCTFCPENIHIFHETCAKHEIPPHENLVVLNPALGI